MRHAVIVRKSVIVETGFVLSCERCLWIVIATSYERVVEMLKVHLK